MLLVGCGETPRPKQVSSEVPTAPPTPANYDGVPAAVSVGPVNRARPTVSSGAQQVTSGVARLTPTAGPSEDGTDPQDGGGGPGERLLDGADPTTLARLYSTPGYLSGGGNLSLTPGVRGGPRGVAPTPTLSTNPQAVRIDSLRTTPTTFLGSYRAAATKVLEVSRTARLVFASANNLKADRTTWTFLFVAAEGPHMWRVIFDSPTTRPDLREVAPSMVADASLIDMTKVLDSPALLDRAVAAGLNTSLPVDIVNFQIEGQTRQPCFIFTNVAQGKQVAIQAYTGDIVRNDFS